MSFTAIHSNRVEELFSSLAATLGTPAEGMDCLAPEYILVDNKVLGEWVNLQLAQQQGIAANIRYQQPAELFWQLARALVSQDIPLETPLSKDEMTWKLYGMLGDAALLQRTDMSPVQHYLSGSEDAQLRRYQLAVSIADLFDQYLVYRPDWMLAWEKNIPVSITDDRNAPWQQYLWQRLAASPVRAPTGLHNRALIEQALLTTLANNNSAALQQKLPMRRLSVFGITAMPPRLVDMLMLLGKHIPVSLYVLNPCEHDWFSIQSAKQLARLKDKTQLDTALHEIGNPLLASQGTQVKEFVESLYSKMDQYENIEDIPAFVEPGNNTLLQAIQQEILSLQYQGAVASLAPYVIEPQRSAVPAGETGAGVIPSIHIPSVHIHNCHSALREVEVLHDQLRDIMQHHPDILPRDIVVMMPQVAHYVPYIHAVFNSVPVEQRLAYQISDRSVAEESPLLHSLELLLALPDSRLSLPDVLSILEVPAVQKKFGLDHDSFETLRAWLVASGVRWGLDAAHREQAGLPAYREFSWEFSLDRLFTGYAMHVTDVATLESIVQVGDKLPVLPLNQIEGGNSDIFDAWLQYWQTLLAWRERLGKAGTPAEWAERLRSLLSDFYAPDDANEAQALKAVYKGIRVLDNADAQAWYSGTIPISVIAALIQPVLQQQSSGRHHWQEGIKFCSLMPMRGVPFKVVYVLGMNLSDYPRRTVQKSFDLMRVQHRAGDRASRIDDRWLFLEALLSARQFFHVSYAGRDMHRNETSEPSVVLSELLDYVQQGYAIRERDFMTQHPMQPFSTQYFQPDVRQRTEGYASRLISYNRPAFHIARAKHAAQSVQNHATQRWQRADVAPVNELQITVDEFVSFFTKPWDWFLKRKMKSDLNLHTIEIVDEEKWSIESGLEAWQHRYALIQSATAQRNSDSRPKVAELVDRHMHLQQAAGQWPFGFASEVAQASLSAIPEHYLYAAANMPAAPKEMEIRSVIQVRDVALHISGKQTVYGTALLFHSPSNKKDHHDLGFALRTMLALDNDATLASAEMFYWNSKKKLAAEPLVLSPATLANDLALLANYYVRFQASGLPFEPETSKAITECPPDEVMDVINDAWYGDGSPRSRGLKDDLATHAYFGAVDALCASEFAEVAMALGRIFKHWVPENENKASSGSLAESEGELS